MGLCFISLSPFRRLPPRAEPGSTGFRRIEHARQLILSSLAGVPYTFYDVLFLDPYQYLDREVLILPFYPGTNSPPCIYKRSISFSETDHVRVFSRRRRQWSFQRGEVSLVRESEGQTAPQHHPSYLTTSRTVSTSPATENFTSMPAKGTPYTRSGSS